MKTFFDTSAFVKKYILEDGWERLDKILETVTDITVAPTYLLEIRSTLKRKVKEKAITPSEAELIQQGIKKDYEDFEKIIWNEILENTALALIEKHQIKTLDSIQLASGVLAKTDAFVTSDIKLFKIAKQEVKNVMLI